MPGGPLMNACDSEVTLVPQLRDSFPWVGTRKGQAGSPGFGGSVRGARNTHFLCFSSQAALSVSRQKFSVTRRSSRLSWSASVYSLSRAVSMSSL